MGLGFRFCAPAGRSGTTALQPHWQGSWHKEGKSQRLSSFRLPHPTSCPWCVFNLSMLFLRCMFVCGVSSTDDGLALTCAFFTIGCEVNYFIVGGRARGYLCVATGGDVSCLSVGWRTSTCRCVFGCVFIYVFPSWWIGFNYDIRGRLLIPPRFSGGVGADLFYGCSWTDL